MTKLFRSPEFTLAASAVLIAGTTALAYSRFGFLGVLLVGRVVLFMAVQSELRKDGIRRLSVADPSKRAERGADGGGEDTAETGEKDQRHRTSSPAIGRRSA